MFFGPKDGRYFFEGRSAYSGICVYLVVIFYGFDPMGFITIFSHHIRGICLSLLPTRKQANPSILAGELQLPPVVNDSFLERWHGHGKSMFEGFCIMGIFTIFTIFTNL